MQSELKLIGTSFRKSQNRDHRYDQNPTEKIADTMYKIKGQPCYDPGYHPLNAESKQEGLHRRVQRPKQKTMDRTDCHIYKGPDPFWHFLRQKHDDPPQNCPYI